MKCEKALEPILNYHWYLETGLNLGFGTTCTNSPFKHSFENKNAHKKLKFVNISFLTPLLVFLLQGWLDVLKQNCRNTSFSFNLIFFNKYTVANIDLSNRNEMISLEKQKELWPGQTPFLQEIHKNWSKIYEVGSWVCFPNHWFEIISKKVMWITCWLPCYIGASTSILGVCKHPYMDFFQIVT